MKQWLKIFSAVAACFLGALCCCAQRADMPGNKPHNGYELLNPVDFNFTIRDFRSFINTNLIIPLRDEYKFSSEEYYVLIDFLATNDPLTIDWIITPQYKETYHVFRNPQKSGYTTINNYTVILYNNTNYQFFKPIEGEPRAFPSWPKKLSEELKKKDVISHAWHNKIYLREGIANKLKQQP